MRKLIKLGKIRDNLKNAFAACAYLLNDQKAYREEMINESVKLYDAHEDLLCAENFIACLGLKDL